MSVDIFVREHDTKLVEYLDEERDSGYYLKPEVYDWFVTNGIEDVYYNKDYSTHLDEGGWFLRFPSTREALMFKLTWGGV